MDINIEAVKKVPRIEVNLVINITKDMMIVTIIPTEYNEREMVDYNDILFINLRTRLTLTGFRILLRGQLPRHLRTQCPRTDRSRAESELLEMKSLNLERLTSSRWGSGTESGQTSLSVVQYSDVRHGYNTTLTINIVMTDS